MILSAALEQRAVIARTNPLNLAPIDTSSATARASVAAQLAAWGRSDLSSDAALIASELVTNAVMASERAGTPIALRMILTTRSVFIEIYDSAPGVPAPRATGPMDESGRGLQLVSDLSQDWGWTKTTTGKVTWAEVA